MRMLARKAGGRAGVGGVRRRRVGPLGLGWAVLVVLGGCADRARVEAVGGLPRLVPGSYSFGMIGLKRSVGGDLRLVNAGRADLIVQSVRIEGDGAGDYQTPDLAGALLAPEEGLPIRIGFAPSTDGVRAATLVVETDSLETPLLTAPIAGLGVEAVAQVPEGALDFGRIELQSERTLALPLRNSSGLTVRVEVSWSGAADEFHAPPALLLGPGESTLLPVTFAPSQLGDARAALQVIPCEGCEPIAIDARGVGLDHALVTEPGQSVDFGALDVDRRAARPVRVTNASDLAVRVDALELEGATDAGYQLGAAGLPLWLGPGKHLDATLTLAPTHLGEARGGLVLLSGSRRWPRLSLDLRGIGGGPEAGASPARLDFGTHAVGSKTALPIRLQNNGGSVVPLQIDVLHVLGDATFVVAWAGPLTLEAGDFVDVPVFFEPDRQGTMTARVAIGTNDGAAPALEVALSGSAQATLPCDLKVTPAALDFGTLPPGQGAVLGLRAENVGRDVCALKDLAVEGDPSGRFSLAGKVPPGFELQPGEWFVRHVAFAGGPEGDFSGRVTFTTQSDATPRWSVPLAAHVQASCVALVPPYLDWGVVRGDCPSSPRTFEAVNRCQAPVSLTSVAVGPGTSDQFALESGPTLPLGLASQARGSFSVSFRGDVLGETLQPLYLGTSELPRPLLLPLLGESWLTGAARDVFFQPGDRQLDVLLVVDNSESMAEEQPRLAAAIPALVAALRGAGIDARFAVTTTGLLAGPGGACPGGVLGGEDGRFFPVDRSLPRVTGLTTPHVEDVLAQATQVGLCHYLEQPFEAARRALSPPLADAADDARTAEPLDGNAGFLRPSASLAVVVVSDEDDHSGADVANYAAFLTKLKGERQPGRVRVVAIAPGPQACATAGGASGLRDEQLVQLVGGEAYDVCQQDYAPPLVRLAQMVSEPQASFMLAQVPEVATLSVTVNGAPASGWSYDAGANAIDFAAASLPAPGSRIEVRYTKPCKP